jgi:putative oxidoreductase
MPSWRCLFAVPPRHGVEAFLLLIARIVAGVMFCVSGWNKVFTDAGRERMVHTLVDAGIPFPVFSAPVLSRPSALLLAAICAVAALTDGIARIPAGLSVPDWLSWFFYLSEVPLGVLLLWIAAVGSGRFAIEARWAR